MPDGDKRKAYLGIKVPLNRSAHAPRNMTACLSAPVCLQLRESAQPNLLPGSVPFPWSLAMDPASSTIVGLLKSLAALLLCDDRKPRLIYSVYS